MKYLSISEHETKFYNLRVARSGVIEKINPKQLIKEIFELKLDLCRIKLNLSNPDIFRNIDSIKLPHSFYSILFRQTINLKKYTGKRDKKLHFVDYKSKDQKILENIVNTVMDHDDNLYYNDEIFNNVFSKELIRKTILDYQTTFDNTINPDKYGFLAYYKEKPIGFCTLQINGKEGEGIYVGILPEFRSRDFFKEFVHTEIFQSKIADCDTYNCNTVVFNQRSLNTTIKQGLDIKDGILNINIFSFLNSGTPFSFKSKIHLLLKNLLEFIQKLEQKNKCIVEFNVNVETSTNGKYLKWNAYSFSYTKSNLLVIFHDEQYSNYGFAKFK